MSCQIIWCKFFLTALSMALLCFQHPRTECYYCRWRSGSAPEAEPQLGPNFKPDVEIGSQVVGDMPCLPEGLVCHNASRNRDCPGAGISATWCTMMSFLFPKKTRVFSCCFLFMARFLAMNGIHHAVTAEDYTAGSFGENRAIENRRRGVKMDPGWDVCYLFKQKAQGKKTPSTASLPKTCHFFGQVVHTLIYRGFCQRGPPAHAIFPNWKNGDRQEQWWTFSNRQNTQ